jgi:hypothetical protein
MLTIASVSVLPILSQAKQLARGPARHVGAQECRMEGQVAKGERIVAIGLLTQRDLDVLGTGFARAFPLNHDTDFDVLLKAIDEAEQKAANPPEASPGPASRC